MEFKADFVLNPNVNGKLVLDPEFRKLFRSKDMLEFHQGLRKYAPTPLLKLTGLAKSLKVKKIYLKDESRRFGIHAFKILGASYAMHSFLKKYPGKYTFCTATDGNHGRAVAWSARRLKQRAVIYVPKDMVRSRIKSIREERARVEVVDGGYDDALEAARLACRKKNYILLQDTSNEDYRSIPRYIVAGYKTLLLEMENELFPAKAPEVDVVFTQTGVGSWSACLTTYLRMRYGAGAPRIVSVESVATPCVMNSFRNGSKAGTYTRGHTIMAGLNCPTPSLEALEIMKQGTDLFISIPDSYAVKAVRSLYYPFKNDPRIFAGESGAAGLAGLMALCSAPELAKAKKKLGLKTSSRVLVFNTEGVTDPELFDELMKTLQ